MKLTEKHLQVYKAQREMGVGRICNDISQEITYMLTSEEWKELGEAKLKTPGYDCFDTPAIHMDFELLNVIEYFLFEAARKQMGEGL